MTEKRKQELEQLLHEAMETIVIEFPEGYESMSVDTYKKHLQSLREQYRPDLNSLTTSYYYPNIQNEAIKSKLLNFIEVQFKDYINKEYNLIQPASYGIGNGGSGGGQPVEVILTKLLQIAIVSGKQRAIESFDKSTRETKGSFQRIILLQGPWTHPEDSDKLTEIEICEGVRLVFLPYNPERLPPYLFDGRFSSLFYQSNPSIFTMKAIIVIDCEVAPLFFKPKFGSPTVHSDGSKSVSPEKDAYPFEIKIKSTELPEFNVDQFCQVTSLTCNFACVPILDWGHIDPDEIYSVRGHGVIPSAKFTFPSQGFGRISKTQIPEIKRLYKILTNLDSDSREKLQIAINRWITSKAEGNSVDKMIDLCIAFESLYLPGIKDELSFRLGVRAAWYLGENKEDRKKLLAEFKAIYKSRSTGVHNGKLNENVTIDGESIPMSKFITRVQDLCRDSITKILDQCSENRKFPDNDYWDNLILS